MNELTLKCGNHTIKKEDVVDFIIWDKTVRGWSGRVEFGKYLPTITKEEIEIIKSWGLTPRLIKSLYRGTF